MTLRHANLAKKSKITANFTRHLHFGKFGIYKFLKFLICNRHFQYNDVIRIYANASEPTYTTYQQLEMHFKIIFNRTTPKNLGRFLVG